MAQPSRKNNETKTGKYTVFRAQADWTLNLQSATSCESDGSLAKKNSAAWPVQVGHIVYFFR
jgi:hypothetical protein